MTSSAEVEEFVSEIAEEFGRCCWLDGGGARGWSGARSLVGWLEPDDVSLTFDAAERTVTRHAGGEREIVGDDIFAALSAEIEASGDPAQWFGYFGYSARTDLPSTVTTGEARAPDAVWMRPSQVRLFEHPDVPDAVPHATQSPARSASREYREAFATVQEHLIAGNSYEVNLTHRLSTASEMRPIEAYRRLRALNPAPYAGYLQHDEPGAEAWLLSSSPERYALIDQTRRIEAKPIKGTLPRFEEPALDHEAAQRLATDQKFRAENLMITDLLRNDLAMVCEPGSVAVPQLMAVESYATVHQLVSTVTGQLRDDVETIDALRSLFPAGSMTGAPKLRTMQIIEEVEASARGVYSGAFGWISATGEADLGVIIRSITTDGSGAYTLGTGGGITVDSDVEEEYAEAVLKAERLLAVFDD